MVKLDELTTFAAADAIRRGEVTSVKLVEACLERIAAREGEVGAWAHVDPEHALRQARAADEWRATGVGTGPLHGVPVGITDIIDTADMPTGKGSAIFEGRRSSGDAACVQALRQSGAVILGKTVTSELASAVPATTHNPRAVERTAGSASAGSAAAVADMMVPLALGTQTADQVVTSASFCGTYAMKPTFGLVSRTGITLQSHTLDTVGMFARSVEDLGLVLDCLSGQDERDAASYPRSRASAFDILREPPPVLPTLAFCPTPVWNQAEQATREAFAELTGELAERCDFVELPLAFEGATAAQQVIELAENAANYGPLLEHARPALGEAMMGRLRQGSAISAREYLSALSSRDVLYAGLARIFERYDAILCAAAPGPAPLAARAADGTADALWTFLGVPCVTLPLLDIAGMPLGVQLVGPRRDDGRLLRTARWLEHHLNEPDST